MRKGCDMVSELLRCAMTVAVSLAAAVILLLTAHILLNGLPNLSLSLFSPAYSVKNASMLPAIVNTAAMIAASLLIAAPLGIFTAVYLAEYAGRGSLSVKIIRLTVETLSGIPSIVYGLFGYLCFVVSLRWGYSFAGGVLTVSMMILPLIISASEQALRSVAGGVREGSLGLGAGKLRTVFALLLPEAGQGIMAGIVLAVGRVAGETAALIFTFGTRPQIINALSDSGRTLAVHMYALSSEGLYTGEAYAAAATLMVMVAGINSLAAHIAKRMTGGADNGR